MENYIQANLKIILMTETASWKTLLARGQSTVMSVLETEDCTLHDVVLIV